MTNNPLFDFIVDKSAQTVTIKREFRAELPLVWDAFTKQELLDQWWAPKPFASKTKSMNFEVGGKRFYAMVTPEGQERWSVQEYTSINPKTNFSIFSTFSDDKGNRELPGSNWDLNFIDQDESTLVQIVIQNDSLERMEKMIEMGFQGGMTAILQQLEDLLGGLPGKS